MARPRLFRSAEYAAMIRGERQRQGWTQDVFGEKIGHDARYVRRIENGHIVPPSLERISLEKALEIDSERSRSVLRQGRNISLEVDENFNHHIQQKQIMAHSANNNDLYERCLSHVDKINADGSTKIEKISYGERTQIEDLAGDLYVLPTSSRLPTEYVPYDGRIGYVIKSLFKDGEIMQMGKRYQIFVPYQVTITGRKHTSSNTVAVYLCTDIFYLLGIDSDNTSDTFSITGFIGRGGIADFVDPNGNPQNWNRYILGDGIGSVGVLTAVEFSAEQPTQRSPYTLVVRRGIRYPDDYWRSITSGRPITPPGIEDLTKTRFIFQSRQPNGNSTDVFVADFNGKCMCNLTHKSASRYDGLLDNEGNEVGKWVDNKSIQYCSMKDGVRRIVQRADCIQSADLMVGL